MVVTGNSAYVIRAYEKDFNGDIGTLLIFGFEQKMSGLEWMNNQTALGQIYTPEVEAFLYGKDAGGLSIEYTMGNFYWLTSILSDPTLAVGDPDVRTWSSDPDDGISSIVNTRIPKTQDLEIGFALIESNALNPEVRRAKGVITQSLNLKTSIDNPVSITETFVWGVESALSTTLNSSVPTNTGQQPFNFVNSNVRLDYGSGITDLIKVQDLDFTFNRDAELLHGFNTPSAVDAFTKLINMTGKVTLAFENMDTYTAVRNRAELSSMSITITNGQSGAALRSLVMTFGGIGLSRQGNPSIQPGEPIFQEFDFICRTVSAVGSDDTAAIDWGNGAEVVT